MAAYQAHLAQTHVGATCTDAHNNTTQPLVKLRLYRTEAQMAENNDRLEFGAIYAHAYGKVGAPVAENLLICWAGSNWSVVHS